MVDETLVPDESDREPDLDLLKNKRLLPPDRESALRRFFNESKFPLFDIMKMGRL
jgi:hypothetical protein